MRVAGIETIGVGHLNGGVKPDLIAETTDTEVAFLLGNGDGTFQYRNDLNVYHVTIGEPGWPMLVPIQLLVMDVNQDGYGDIVTSNHGRDSVSVVLHKGQLIHLPP
ncbi:MAG: hypothetical protein HZB38_13595 [Planctomycetes bacterium]|nr:hypothetical protein [Planctomycetota bacterium]